MDCAEPPIDPASGTDDWPYLWERRCELRVRVLTNRYYQQERQRIHELREGFVKVASLVSGSVAFAGVMDPGTLKAAAAVLVVGSASALVFTWGSKSRDAAKRAADWAGIERDIARGGERAFTEKNLDEWEARCNETEASEPALNPVLHEHCFRRACKALGRKFDPKDGPWGYDWRWPLLVP